MATSNEVGSFGKRVAVAAEASKENLGGANPSLSPEEKLAVESTQRKRIPMSSPKAKLSTPVIPGFHLHWMNDYAGRISQALEGGYEFVKPEETFVNSNDFAGLGEMMETSGTDLGSRVSVVVGKNEDGTPLRAYLMKIREEWYVEDQAAGQTRVEELHEAMRQGKQQQEQAHAYVKRVQMKSTYSKTS